MTKRERDSLIRKIGRIEARVAKKRDEIRICVDDLNALIESINSADEAVDGALANLRNAREALDREVADRLSEYV